MDIIIQPQRLSGIVHAIPSKSQAHRLLICSAFADRTTHLICQDTNQDIEATAACLRALGATIDRTENAYIIEPIKTVSANPILPCNESGSTLRFMLPIVGALGVSATFTTKGRLSARPLSPLWEEMERMGCRLSRPTADTIQCQGQLQPGKYSINGGISSQFITGLVFAISLIDGNSQIEITGNLESKPYIDMTQQALAAFKVNTAGFIVNGNQTYRSPGIIEVEGDWSNGAFFLVAQHLGSNVTVTGLPPTSHQGDRRVADILPQLSKQTTICCADIPDLVPILSVAAAAGNGATFTSIQRLRLKESDRVSSIINMLSALGVRAESTESTLTVHPGNISGGTVDSANDHRIAMSAAIAATIANDPIIIRNAQCVEKSYPKFWDEYKRLGGNYEQYIR